jgi:DNA-binding LytR/AlgR family response regulator
MPTALIADDEPLLRDRLEQLLARLWPGLQVVAQARNGREALALFETHQPDLVFLDVHMPGMNGVEAARAINRHASGRRTHLVFVTAFEQYAVQAFEHGAIDYLVKPFDEERLQDTVARLMTRLMTRLQASDASVSAEAADPLAPLLERLEKTLQAKASAPAGLQWIKASVGNAVRLIPVDELIYLRSDEKYTLVVWQGGEALIRKTIRELAEELDAARFVQIHRSVIVALHQVLQVVRGPNETADLHLRGRKEVLPVSRAYLHLFKQM